MSTQPCPKCGSLNRPGAKFCNTCGQLLYPVPVVIPPTQVAGPGGEAGAVTCPNCQRPNQAGATHCFSCGQALYAPSPYAVPPAQPVDIYTPAPSPYTPQQPADMYPPPLMGTPPPMGGASTSIWKRPGLLITIAGLALVGIICIAAGYFVYKKISEPLDKVKEVIGDVGTKVKDIATAINLEGTIDLKKIATTIPTILPIPKSGDDSAPIKLPGLDAAIPRLTDEEEIKIGREAAKEFEKENAISKDPALNDRVRTIGEKIVPHQPRKNIPYTFKVVDSDEINAFALPGGFIYINRGMIEYVKNDNELAGVVGHEIAHVALRHGAQRIEKIAAAQAAIDAIGKANPDFQTIYDDNATQIAVELVGQIVMSGWGREMELDADEYGTVYMSQADYKAQAVLDLFHRFEAEEEKPSDPISALLATHPPFSERIARVEETITKYNLT